MSGSKAQISNLECVCESKKKWTDCAPRGWFFCRAAETHVAVEDVMLKHGAEEEYLGSGHGEGQLGWRKTCGESVT